MCPNSNMTPEQDQSEVGGYDSQGCKKNSITFVIAAVKATIRILYDVWRQAIEFLWAQRRGDSGLVKGLADFAAPLKVEVHVFTTRLFRRLREVPQLILLPAVGAVVRGVIFIIFL